MEGRHESVEKGLEELLVQVFVKLLVGITFCAQAKGRRAEAVTPRFGCDTVGTVRLRGAAARQARLLATKA
ncbi:MAG: hypothetical protein ACUVX9_19300, partial [Anaerolineae bacterium]